MKTKTLPIVVIIIALVAGALDCFLIIGVPIPNMM